MSVLGSDCVMNKSQWVLQPLPYKVDVGQLPLNARPPAFTTHGQQTPYMVSGQKRGQFIVMPFR